MSKKFRNSIRIPGAMLLFFALIELIKKGNTDKFWIQSCTGVLLFALFVSTEQIIAAIKSKK